MATSCASGPNVWRRLCHSKRCNLLAAASTLCCWVKAWQAAWKAAERLRGSLPLFSDCRADQRRPSHITLAAHFFTTVPRHNKSRDVPHWRIETHVQTPCQKSLRFFPSVPGNQAELHGGGLQGCVNTDQNIWNETPDWVGSHDVLKICFCLEQDCLSQSLPVKCYCCV